MTSKPSIRYNRKKGDRILLNLLDWFENKKGMYEAAHFNEAPQNQNVPGGVVRGSMEHMRYEFLTVSIMYRDQSEQTFQYTRHMWENHPEVFTQNMPAQNALSVMFKDLGFSDYNAKARNWHGCGKALFEKFNGDPREIFSFGTVDKFLAFKKKSHKSNNGVVLLPGFGPKTYSLLNHFFREINAVNLLPDAFPVDRHIMRQFVSWDVVVGRGVHDATLVVAELIRKEVCRFSRKYSKDLVAISHAMWLLGTWGCRNCRRIDGIEYLCPAYTDCRGAVYNHLSRSSRDWNLGDRRVHPKGSLQFVLAGDWDIVKLVVRERKFTIRKNVPGDESSDTNTFTTKENPNETFDF